MTLPEGIDADRFSRLIALAREEDFNSAGDITTALMPEGRALEAGVWEIVPRREGRLCGNVLLPTLLLELAPSATVELIEADGTDVGTDRAVARISGPTGEVFSAERIVLNFLQRLSGVATLTRSFVRAVEGTAAKIYDTRKTTPGLRDLEKYAVRMGGGCNHRDGLFDAVLIKDNHLAGSQPGRLAYHVFEMLNGLDRLPARPRFVEVEVDSLDQFRELLVVVGIDVILLDNFETASMGEAVGLRDRAGLRGKVALEASGGVNLETIRAIAQTGVERISIGALTHSAPILDLGLDAVE